MYTYKVYNRWGELLAEGTAKECAAKVNLTVGGFRKAVDRMRDGHTGRLVIKEFEYKPDSEIILMQDAAAKWDRFCEPIRKKYGIKVR